MKLSTILFCIPPLKTEDSGYSDMSEFNKYCVWINCALNAISLINNSRWNIVIYINSLKSFKTD